MARGRGKGKDRRVDRKRVQFRGEMRTYDEIAEIIGVHVNTIRSRISQGIPLDSPRQNVRNLVTFRGQLMSISDVARETGRSWDAVKLRLDRGVELDADHVPTAARVSANVTDDNLRIEEDKQAQYVESYLAAGEPMLSAQEIAESFADDPEWESCDLEEAVELREALRRELFAERPTLELVGELRGTCRERVRQIQETALHKLRTRSSMAVRDMRDSLAVLQTMRKVV